MTEFVRRWAPLLLAAALSTGGCGTSLSHTVDDSTLRDMSRNGRLWVYDAENEIVVALDQLDEAKDELRGVRYRLKRAERSQDKIEKKGNALAEQMAEARVDFLEALEEWAEAEVRFRIFGILVARAQVEYAKAQVIQREDLLGGKDFSPADYKQQAEELTAEQEARKKRVAKLRRAARKMEAKWWRARRRFVAQTGDHDTGLWID
jgi:chromosome segregation ATPase